MVTFMICQIVSYLNEFLNFTEEKTSLEDNQFPEKPEVVVFATYWSPSKYPVKVSVMGEMV